MTMNISYKFAWKKTSKTNTYKNLEQFCYLISEKTNVSVTTANIKVKYPLKTCSGDGQDMVVME